MISNLFRPVNFVLGSLAHTKGFSIAASSSDDTLLLDIWASSSEDYWRRIHSKIKHSTIKGVVSIYKNHILIACVAIKSEGNALKVERVDVSPAATNLDILIVFFIMDGLVSLIRFKSSKITRIVLRSVPKNHWSACKKFGYTCNGGACPQTCGCSGSYMTFEK